MRQRSAKKVRKMMINDDKIDEEREIMNSRNSVIFEERSY